MIQEKLDQAIGRIQLAAAELRKVIDNSPDVRKEVQEVAGWLFQSQQYPLVRDHLRDLSKAGADVKLSNHDNDGTEDQPVPTGQTWRTPGDRDISFYIVGIAVHPITLKYA